MISLSMLYIIVVMLSKLGKPSLAFDSQHDDDDYVRTNGQSNVENLMNISGGEKKPLVVLIPLKDIDQTKIDETGKLNEEDHRRHTRCKYSRMPKKSRRTTSEEDPDKYLFLLKSASEGIVEKPNKRQHVRKASVQKATRLRDLIRNSRTMNSKNNESIRRRGIVPQSQDSVILIGKESVEPTNETLKKYVCSCTEGDDETEKLPKKPITSNVSSKNKRWPYTLGQNEYRNDEIHGKSSAIRKPKETVGDKHSKKSSSDKISTDESIRSKELSQLTDKIVQPMRIAIPLVGEPVKDSIYSKVNNEWPFFRILRKDYRSNDQASFEVVQPYLIVPDVLHQTPSATFFRPAYHDNFPGTNDYSSKETASKLFSGQEDSLHDTFALTPGQNSEKMDECIDLHGLENCILASKASDHRAQTDSNPESDQPKVGSPQRKESDQAATFLPFFDSDEPMSAYKSLERNEVGVDALQNALEYQLDRVNDQQPPTSFQYISSRQPTRPVGNTQEYDSSSTERNNIVTLKQQRAATKDFDQYRHVKPLMPRNDLNDRLTGYSEVSRQLEENEISKKVLEEYLSEYPRLWTVGKSQNHQKSMSNRYQMMIAQPIKNDLSRENILKKNDVHEVTDEILGQSQQDVSRINESGDNRKNVISGLPLVREPKLPLTRETLDEFCSSHEGATSDQILREYIESLFRNSGINVQQTESPIVQEVVIENPSTDAAFHVDKSDVWDSPGHITTRPEASRKDSAEQLSSDEVPKVPIKKKFNISVNKVSLDPPKESIFKNGPMEEKKVFVGDTDKDLKMQKTMMTKTEKSMQISSPTTKTWTMNVNESGSTDKTIDATSVIDPDENIHAESNTEYQYVKHVTGLSDVSATKTKKSSLAYQSRTERAEDEKTPIKYYSPADRILAYKKKSQTLNVTPHSEEQMTIDFQPARSQGHPLSPASLKSGDSPSVTEDFLKLFHSETPTSIPDNDDDHTAVPLDSVDENHDLDTNAFYYKNEPWKTADGLEHSEVVESSPMFDEESFSHIDATDHYITDPLVGSENRAWTKKLVEVTKKSTSAKSTKFRNMFNPTYKRSDSQTTEEFNQEGNPFTTDESAEKNSQDVLGTVNFGDVRSEISGTGYKKTAERHTSQPEFTETEEKAAFIERTSELPEVPKNAPVQSKSAIPIGAAKNPQNHSSRQKNPNERVSSYPDKNINYGASLDSIDRSNYATPPYDPTYFGTLTFDPVNPIEENDSDLTSTNLFYIGDGVKIPLKITRMSDRSWGLAISEKICNNFVERECPCYSVSGVNVVEKKKRSNEASNKEYKVESTTGKNHIFSDQTENSVSTDEPNGRYTRSSLEDNVAPTSTKPAIQFAEAYNLTPELTEFPNDSAGSSGKVVMKESTNIGQRDRVESSINQPMTKSSRNIDRIKSDDDSEDATRIFNDYDIDNIAKRSNSAKSEERIYDTNSDEFVENHLRVEDPSNSPQNTEKKLRDIDELGGKNPKSRLDNDDDAMANELAKYGYQRNNPILQRIKFIGEKQMEQAPYRYQRNIDHDAREKIDAITTLLHWLRNVFLESALNNDP